MSMIYNRVFIGKKYPACGIIIKTTSHETVEPLTLFQGTSDFVDIRVPINSVVSIKRCIPLIFDQIKWCLLVKLTRNQYISKIWIRAGGRWNEVRLSPEDNNIGIAKIEQFRKVTAVFGIHK